MKFLRDYDEVLDTTVLSILEQSFADGVRSCQQTKAEDHDPVTAIPSNLQLFPEIEQSDIDSKDSTPSTKQNLPISPPRFGYLSIDDWARANLEDDVDKYVLGIQRFAKKMASVTSNEFSWASHGATCTAEISNGIFSRINALREMKSTKQVKQRALVDLFKCLKEQGYSCMKWSVPSSIRDPHHLMQLPVPSTEPLSDKNRAIVNALEKGESYFHRCQVEITRLRFEIAMLGSQYMSQREMTLMQGYSEHIFFIICQQRSMIAGMIQSIGSIELCLQSYEDVGDIIPMGQASLRGFVTNFEESMLSLVESLHQLVLLIKESSYLITNDTDRATTRDIIARVKKCIFDLEQRYSPRGGKLPITLCRICSIDNMGALFSETKTELLSCVKACRNILPASIFDTSFEHLEDARLVASAILNSSNVPGICDSGNGSIKNTIRHVSRLVQNTLIAAQSISYEKPKEGDDSTGSESITTYTSHVKMIQEWSNLQLDTLQLNLHEISDALIQLHDGGVTCTEYERSLCTMAAVNSFSLVVQILKASKSRLEDASMFYHQQSKMLYILLRVFRVLISKGFCSDNVADGGEGEGDDGAGEMKFEDDVEGTGMGEGDGKQDVTDQIENEEQLLGVKGDELETSQSSQDKKELDKEEAETGMEMEADFQGETYDLPEEHEGENENENENNDEEELDREMGDGNDPNEQVVDEKMWDNEEDDINDIPEEEKFEDNSKISGEKIQDELRTKDQSDEDKGNGNDGNEMHHPDQQQEEENNDDAQEPSEDDGNPNLDRINDDNEENYEDKHGVEVRNDEDDAEKNDEDDLNVNDNLDLDGDDNNGTEANEAEEESGDRDESGSNADTGSERGEAESAENDCGMAVEDEANEMMNDEESCDPMETVGHGGGGADVNNDEHSATEEEEEEEEDDGESQQLDLPSKSRFDSNEDAIGVAADDGQDVVDEHKQEISEEETTDGKLDDVDGGNNDHVGQSFHGSGGSGNDGDWQRGEGEEKNSKSQNEAFEIPNPFRSPGDAEKYWHKKLDIIQDDHAEENESPSNLGQGDYKEDEDNDGLFEYTKEGEDNTGQVLGVADEDQAKHLEDNNDDDFEINKGGADDNETRNDEDVAKHKQDPSMSSRASKSRERENDQENDKDDEMKGSEVSEPDIMQDRDELENTNERNQEEQPTPTTTTASIEETKKLFDTPEKIENDRDYDEIIEIDDFNGISEEGIRNARKYWQTIQSETNNLSRRLCEKLRLVMEPLVATKLRGDYRTGKRVNMKRIIGYVASGYRKDKIWLRRTKPAKRDYRVLIAVDDSESMQKSQAGDMALRALATLANGMSQLEIGQLGVASFGEDMRLLHPFNLPFTSESGVNVVSNFKFDDKRTRTALCVESSINVLEGVESVSSSMQLVFMISDGRIERDSRSKLRRLIREMSEKNMLMVMIIVEGENNSKDSILSMKEVSFVNGKPHVKHFIEDYPFPYYLVVGDLAALPEILGDALRQWFEMLAQI